MKKINSNINLHYIPMTKLKTTTVGVYIHRPLVKSEVSENAVLPYVLKRGCKLCGDSSKISKYLENLYGATFGTGVLKRGDDQIIYFSFETISDRFAPEGEKLVQDIIKLAMSVVFEPVQFNEEVTVQEKNNAKDRILAEINDKRRYAMMRCSEEMCKGDSFELPALGTVEGVESITADSLRKHYEKIITSSVIDIYICGEFNENEIEKELKEASSCIAFKEANMPKSNIFSRSGDVKRVTDRMDVVQGKLSMGFRTNIEASSSDYISLMVMNSIFGGGAHSKLFNNVREKLSLCYYASSTLVRNKGIMFVNAGIEFENFEKAYNEILLQLDCIKKGEISELEYSSSINALTDALESYKDDQHMLQLFYLNQKLACVNDSIEDVKEKISKVTIDDVVNAASKIELDTVYFLDGKEEK